MLMSYDLLLLDLNLPDINGIEICQRLRKTHPHLLILMLTARGSAQQRITGLDVGADDYLVKPFHFGELVARIRALLRRDMRGRDPVLRYQDITLDPSAHVAYGKAHNVSNSQKKSLVFSNISYIIQQKSSHRKTY